MYLNVETSYYGSGPCIIFRPDGIDSYDGTYSVHIDGVQTNSGENEPIQYDVVFYGDTALTSGISASDKKTEDDEKIVFSAHMSSWAEEEVIMALVEGIIPVDELGVDYTINITRSQFAALVVKMMETVLHKQIVYAPNSPFTDTSDKWVLKANAAGIVNGTSATTFSPYANITREQLATMLYRTIQYIQDKGRARVITKIGNLSQYTDSNQVHNWAKESMSALCGNGIMQGISTTVLNPSGTATIEQAVILAYRVFDMI